MRKIVSLLKLYIPKSYSSLYMLTFSGLALFFNLISLPCEQLETPKYSLIYANSYICLNEEFHKLFINFIFIFPLILVTIFISINANYFLLALHSCRERISSDSQTNEYLKDLTLLSSVGIPNKTIFNSIFIFKGLFILLTIFILNLSRIIIFFRTSTWTGVTFDAFVFGILLSLTIALLTHILMLNSPNTNLLSNIFTAFFSLGISLLYIMISIKITDTLYYSFRSDQALVNKILAVFNTTQTNTFRIVMLLTLSLIIVLSIIYIFKNHSKITTFKSIINIKANDSSTPDKIFRMIFIIFTNIIFFTFVILLLNDTISSFLFVYLMGIVIYQLITTIKSIKSSKKMSN